MRAEDREIVVNDYAAVVRAYGEIQTSLEAKTACLEIAALLVELGKAKTTQELLDNLDRRM